MEYKRLAGLDNQYPTISNYKSGTTNDTAVLYGNYADKNKVDFTFPSIKDLKWVKGTAFRFILVISKDQGDTNPLLYTSEVFYNDLISSMNEENPYFSYAAFNPSYMVQFFVSDILNTFKSTHDLEKKDGVLMYRNTFVNSDGSIDYESLVAYIDWTVSKVDPLDVDNGGVLSSTLLGVWDYLAIDPITNIVSDTITKAPTTAISGNSNSNTALKVQQDLFIKSTQDDLNKVLKQITDLQNELSSKNNYKFISLGFGQYSSNVTIGDFSFKASGTKSNATKGVDNQIQATINDLKTKQIKYQSDISSALNVSPSGVANQTQSLVNNIQSLAGRIPKTLPSLPQIPKIPNVTDLKAMLPALPAVPALPKLPKVPKIPSLKLPPIPKFKPKIPKVPKKLAKGLGGLKGAIGGVTGAIAGATAAAAGAAAAAKAAADKAKAAADSAKAAADSAKGALDNAKNNLPKI